LNAKKKASSIGEKHIKNNVVVSISPSINVFVYDVGLIYGYVESSIISVSLNES
jgi:hypothetical protein